jgi:DNA-binding NarL/FixJ family response regulator
VSLRGYSDAVAELSPRMVVVLRAASQGRTVAETALELHLAESTVASIRAAACARLGVSNVIQAVTVSIRAGVL